MRAGAADKTWFAVFAIENLAASVVDLTALVDIPASARGRTGLDRVVAKRRRMTEEARRTVEIIRA